MKRALLRVVVLAALCVPVLAHAQGGTIAVYADPLGENCYPLDVATGVLQVYVVHTDMDGATASSFRVKTGNEFKGVYLGEYPALDGLTYGFAYEGIMMAYGGCRVAPVHLLTISFYVTGASPKCCYFEVVENPNGSPPGLIGIDCDFTQVEVQGGTTYVNPNGECLCSLPGDTTPVEPATWSRIKSMYADN